ncbi:MAG: transglycosylase domain-containing protein [Enterococcus sp.]
MPQQKKRATKRKKTLRKRPSNWFYFNISLRVVHSLILVAVSFLIIFGALAAGICAGYFAYLVEDTPTPTKEELQKDLGDVAETSKLTYVDNSDIATIRSDLMRTNVESDEISDLLKEAIISTEDEYFYEHNGWVPKAIIRAGLSEVTGLGSSGGSTLTQQLVKQQVLTNETTFERKANEILLSMQVEKYFSKDEIVTLYLNVSPFGRNNKGENIAGVQEAAQGIFGIDAKDVNLPQAAFIAGLPQSPIVYSPYDYTGEIKDDVSIGLDRKDFVLFSMYRNHAITKEEYEEAKDYDLEKDFLPQDTAEVQDPDFLYYSVLGEAQEIVAKQMAKEDDVPTEKYSDPETQNAYLEKAGNELVNGGYTVKSTIDKNIYDAMQTAVAQFGYLLDMPDGTEVEVGNVLLDNSTGAILGFIGGRDFTENQNNHAFDTERQAGSSIKPLLVYGPSIDQGLIGSETQVSDYPATWKDGENKGEDIVNATNKGTKTFISARDALNISSNLGAYNIYQDLQAHTSDTFAYDNYLQKMNFPSSETWSFESAPLGTTGVTTLQETNGYQTLANGGVYQEAYLIESITDSQGNAIYKHKANPVQVYSKATASIMNDMMRSVLDAGLTTSFKSTVSNLNWNLSQADWVGKTGSSDYHKDSWLIVSTPTVTLSSWSGQDDYSQESDDDAGTRTANYMAYLANQIQMADPEVFGTDQSFTLDDSVKEETVSKVTGELPGDVSHDGKTVDTSKDTVTSYWTKDTVPESTYKFGIGGTEANYETYWKNYLKTGSTDPVADDSEDDDQDDTDDPDSEDENTDADTENE